MIGEHAALDLALCLGMSTDAGLAYLGKALELCYRLPRLYARVDQTIAPFLHTCAWAAIDRDARPRWVRACRVEPPVHADGRVPRLVTGVRQLTLLGDRI